MAREQDIDAFVEELGAALKIGWEGFTGTIVEMDPAHPDDVPDDYIMRPSTS